MMDHSFVCISFVVFLCIYKRMCICVCLCLLMCYVNVYVYDYTCVCMSRLGVCYLYICVNVGLCCVYVL